MSFSHKKFLFTLCPVFLGLFFCCASCALANGTIDSTEKYAWSENMGWIVFSTDGAGSVSISDSELTGYAWSDNYGWINLAPAGSGVKNTTDGVLSGYAWGENTGWINFSGVTINSSGYFTGAATGTICGDISFDCSNCKVKTDWTPSSGTVESTPSGSVGGGSSEISIGFLINNGADATNSQNVVLNFPAMLSISEVSVSNYENFDNAKVEEFQKTKNWVLLPGDGEKTVYVKFFTKYGNPYYISQDSIVLDTVGPELSITKIKESYNISESVIIGGTTEPESRIDLLIDNVYYTQFSADKLGSWLVNLGEYDMGSHNLKLAAKDLAGNFGKTVDVDFSVKQPEITEGEPQKGISETMTETLLPFLGVIRDRLNVLFPNIIKPKEVEPTEVVVVPKVAPLSFSAKWNLLPEKEIREFVLSPLPEDIRIIAKKFPELSDTLSNVGIEKITDVSKLKLVSFKLPSITQTANFLEGDLETKELSSTVGIPIASLTSYAKSQIPSEIIFSKTGGGKIDFNTQLSINDAGKTEQRISTLTRNIVQFIVKVDNPVKAIKGYLVFKSRQYKKISSGVSLNSLTASLMFDNPDFTEPTEKEIIDTNESETKLVLQEFDFIDTGDGVYTADVEMPVVKGEYEVMAIINYKNEALGIKQLNLITVVDPEGYVYEKSGDKETRISGAIVSLYWLNPSTKQYELWPGENFQQENPQVTDVTGNYSFLVPNGFYYIKVSAPGYLIYDGKPLEVKEGSGVHINIELKTKYWWLSAIDWKTVLLIIAVAMVLYNFYRDRARDLSFKNQVGSKM